MSKSILEKHVRRYLPLAGILLLTFAVFSPNLSHDFISNDDPGHLLHNPHVRQLTPRIFFSLVNHTYIPLTVLSFAVEHTFFGFDPFVYHLDNLLLHLANTALVFFLFLRMGFSARAVFLAALLFGIHPLHVESVAWVTERKDVLYAFFYLLSLNSYWAYISSGKSRSYVWSAVFAALSILSKPMALSLPLIMLLFDWYKGRRFDARVWAEKIPHCLIVGSIALITYLFFARVPGETPQQAFLVWIWTFVFYIRKFLFPGLLLAVYNIPKPVTLFHPSYLGSLLAFAAFAAGLWRWRANRLLIFAFAFYIGSIFFLLRFDDTMDINVVADRFMYLPMTGFCLLFGVYAARFLQWAEGRQERVKAAALICLLVLAGLLGARTFQQSRVWGDSIRLWSDVLRYYPDEFIALDHRAYAYGRAGEYEKSIADYTKAFAIHPDYAAGYNNRGIAYGVLGKKEEAGKDFRRALELDPGHVNTYYNRGVFHYKEGNFEEALADFSKVIELRPLHLEAWTNRGLIYLQRREYERALMDFNFVLSVHPSDFKALNSRAFLFWEQNMYYPALSDLDSLIEGYPRDPELYFYKAQIYLNLGETGAALENLKAVLFLNPGHAGARKILEQNGRKEP